MKTKIMMLICVMLVTIFISNTAEASVPTLEMSSGVIRVVNKEIGEIIFDNTTINPQFCWNTPEGMYLIDLGNVEDLPISVQTLLKKKTPKKFIQIEFERKFIGEIDEVKILNITTHKDNLSKSDNIPRDFVGFKLSGSLNDFMEDSNYFCSTFDRMCEREVPKEGLWFNNYRVNGFSFIFNQDLKFNKASMIVFDDNPDLVHIEKTLSAIPTIKFIKHNLPKNNVVVFDITKR